MPHRFHFQFCRCSIQGRPSSVKALCCSAASLPACRPIACGFCCFCCCCSWLPVSVLSVQFMCVCCVSSNQTFPSALKSLTKKVLAWISIATGTGSLATLLMVMAVSPLLSSTTIEEPTPQLALKKLLPPVHRSTDCRRVHHLLAARLLASMLKCTEHTLTLRLRESVCVCTAFPLLNIRHWSFDSGIDWREEHLSQQQPLNHCHCLWRCQHTSASHRIDRFSPADLTNCQLIQVDQSQASLFPSLSLSLSPHADCTQAHKQTQILFIYFPISTIF